MLIFILQKIANLRIELLLRYKIIESTKSHFRFGLVIIFQGISKAWLKIKSIQMENNKSK